MLEGENTVVEVDGVSLGVAGVKGFGGGFAGKSATDFGEPEMKAFVRHTKDVSERLREALGSLDTEHRIALMHYAPVKETLFGEPPEIYGFLGSYLLAEACDAAGADLILHGHAKVADFGLARMGGSTMTKTATIMGTPGYMSPEQARGRTLDGRSDLFSRYSCTGRCLHVSATSCRREKYAPEAHGMAPAADCLVQA